MSTVVIDAFFAAASAGEATVDFARVVAPGLGVALGAWACSCAWDRWQAARARRAADRDEFYALLRQRAQITAEPRIDTRPGASDATLHQLEDLYAAPDYTREGEQ
ncbi:hypothetical protein [Streptomyces sp. NPDC059783]|uniref:hypothetical protein n=1 Tax=Streptomyces sp. NPDC059783 TaxID=3346944 RepID=UPI00365D5228